MGHRNLERQKNASFKGGDKETSGWAMPALEPGQARVGKTGRMRFPVVRDETGGALSPAAGRSSNGEENESAMGIKVVCNETGGAARAAERSNGRRTRPSAGDQILRLLRGR